MEKFFVVSDIHSFFTPFKTALDRSGFDPQNEKHWLIVCGDSFDRGSESEEVLRYLMTLKRKILIRGNHETLLEECCMREYPNWCDGSNGTKKTIQDLGRAGEGRAFDECCQVTMNRTAFYRHSLLNYFETQNYIFVHGWIPCAIDIDTELPAYNPDWRKCSDTAWENAQWFNGIDMSLRGIIEPGKTIVCGHWHCSYGHEMDNKGTIPSFGEGAVWDPWYHEGCIAIDRCTAHTKEVNVLVLEDDFLINTNE